jgi:hypothetical protein
MSSHWPPSCPEDLRYHLETVLGFRSYGPQEVYGAFKEWAEKHGVPAPEGLREQPGRETRHEL